MQIVALDFAVIVAAAGTYLESKRIPRAKILLSNGAEIAIWYSGIAAIEALHPVPTQLWGDGWGRLPWTMLQGHILGAENQCWQLCFYTAWGEFWQNSKARRVISSLPFACIGFLSAACRSAIRQWFGRKSTERSEGKAAWSHMNGVCIIECTYGVFYLTFTWQKWN